MQDNIKIQNLLTDTDLICFVIPSLFTKTECTELLTADIKNSFQKAISNYPTYYRNNDRFVIDSEDLAKKIFEKVLPYLPKTIEKSSNITTENGIWQLLELNNRLRFCKYSANQYFHRHLDGVHYRSENVQSKLTFMIYLNDAQLFEGGKTLFYKSKNTTEIWASYTPKEGDLIVFDHNVWHEGEVLKSGEKYVLRSDILYKRLNNSISKQAFKGHLGYIWKILKFDNFNILSGGRDKIINLWNLKGEILQTLHGHENSILCIEKINNNTFISGSRDKNLIIWQKNKSGQFEYIKTINIHSALVLSICRLTDTQFVSSSGDNTIKICNLDGKVQKTLIAHDNWVWQVIKIAKNIIASCSEDKSIKIWNTKMNEVIEDFSEEQPLFCIEYNQNNKQLLSGNLKGEIVVVTLSTNFKEQKREVIQAHNGIVRTIKFINDIYIVSGGEDNKVKVWNTKNNQCVLEFEHQNFVQSVEIINNKLLSASYDGSIKTWELNNNS